MKMIALVIVLFTLGCGQQDNPPHGWNEILWEGHASQDAALAEQVAGVQACMKEYGYSREGDPYFVVVDTEFWCGDTFTIGCFHDNTITIATLPYTSISTAINVKGSAVDPFIIRHETIHWITGKGNADHDTEYMNICTEETVTLNYAIL